MNHWHFYSPDTGELSGMSYCGPERLLKRNTPAGMKAIRGVFDHLSQRIDTSTGCAVPWRPPQPSVDHEWNGKTRRWHLRQDVEDALHRRNMARSRILALEARQPRALREWALGKQGAVERLAAIEADIEQLRTILNG